MSVMQSRPPGVNGLTDPPGTTPRVKLMVPPVRDRMVPRTRLVERLADPRHAVCVVAAPAGYGKTTLLAEFARMTPRVAWVRLDETDDDPTVLLADIVEALGTVAPLDPGLRSAVTTPAEQASFQAPARLTEALGGLPESVTLILDDVHHLVSHTARDWLVWVLDRLPPQVRVVLASRHGPDLPLGRLDAAGRLLELGAADLALRIPDITRLGGLTGIPLTEATAVTLLARTEGWPLAAQLLLHATESGRSDGVEAIGGDATGEASIVRYLRSELLDRMEPGMRDWVLRSAVLDEMTGPLCDAALETTGSLGVLRSLERDNQLVLPLDAARTSYRYHVLYRELLRAELEARLPGQRAHVAVRASAWLHEHGRSLEAGQVLASAEDLDALAAHIERAGPAIYWRGGLATIREWSARFDHDGVRERYAGVAVLGAWMEALLGNLTPAMRWLGAAERSADRRVPSDGSPDFSGWLATLRANMMPRGAAGHDADVRLALAVLPPDSPVVPQLHVQLVVREILAGRPDEADARARESEEVHRAHGAMPGLTVVLGLRAAVAAARADTAAAALHVREGCAIVERAGLEGYLTSALLYGVGARLAAGQGDRAEAHRMLARLNVLRPMATAVIPWHAVMMRLQGIRAAIALREPGLARTLAGEIDDVLRLRPDLGALLAEVDQVRPVVDSLRTAEPSAWTLTTAELRLLRYLPTHLTFREIAERMVLSTHTIKTQAMSIYGKLEVSSRREAIEQAVEVGLLDPSVLHQADGVALIA